MEQSGFIPLFRIIRRKRPVTGCCSMRYGSRSVRKRRNIQKALCCCLIAAMIPFFIFINAKFKPIIHAACISKTEILAAQAVNGAATRIISENIDTYSSLISLERTSEGRITSLTTDSAKVNLLKSNITTGVQAALLELSEQDISIPVGSALGGGLFIGRGPKIKIKLRPLNSVTTDFQSSFADAGINQTRHSVSLNITVSVQALAAGHEEPVSVSTSFIVAESIIIGDVPQTLADIF